MKIAVEGCCHGELDKIYETIGFLEKQDGIKVDLLLCCGDFQAVRNRSDLTCMAVPQKYQRMNTFYKYYSGEKKAPIMTLFIGGNHEASNYLQELAYGGWVAPNIYYLGYASVVKYGGVRISGLSGIFKGRDYQRGHFECAPYTKDTIRSAYHVRNLEVFRLKQISTPVDIAMSHDWPRGVYNHGPVESLLKRKEYFRDEIERNVLGSPAAEELLHAMKPDYWFSGHLHCKFPAVIEHKSEDGSSKSTKFLALDKCLPRKQFLQVIDIPDREQRPYSLELDPEWLVVLKKTDHLLSVSCAYTYLPGPGSGERYDFTVEKEEIDGIRRDFDNLLKIPENFEQTVPLHDPSNKKSRPPPAVAQINPQTSLLCEMLGIRDPMAILIGKESDSGLDLSDVSAARDRGEVSFDAFEDPDASNMSCYSEVSFSLPPPKEASFTENPDEISLGEEDDNDDDKDNDDDDDDVPSGDTQTETEASDLDLPKASTPTSAPELKSMEEFEQQTEVASKPESILDTSGVQAESESLSLDTPSKESPTEGKRPSDSEETPNRKKKFKRRNQSIYTAEDDD